MATDRQDHPEQVEARHVVSRLSATRKPAWAIVYLKGFPHLIHLRALRRALLDKAIAGEDHAIMDVAKKLGISRSTLSRLFAGRNVSINVLRPVLQELGLEFERVCFPLEGELLDALIRHGTVERNGTTLLTVDPLSLPEAAQLKPRLQLLDGRSQTTP
jgi:transcriptional regulator with XRE-family HTH domain